MRILSSRLLHAQAVSNLVLVVALAGLVTLFATQSANFLSAANVAVLLNNAAALGIIVVPFTALVISGNIDFSVGSTAGLTGTVAAVTITQWGLPQAVGIGLALLLATAVGVLNAVLCVVLRFNPIIVTLGMLGALRGGTLLLQKDQIYGVGSFFVALGTTTLLGLPLAVWIAGAVFVAGAVVLSTTPAGRYIYAIGANPRAAFLSALPVRTLPFALYVVTSLCAGVSGLVFTARLNGVSPAATGEGLEFAALTVVLLGGVAFAGGRGSLLGVFVAWLFLAVLQNGLVITNVTPYVQTTAAGLALVLAAALDRLGTTLLPRLHARRHRPDDPAPGRPTDTSPVPVADRDATLNPAGHP